MERIKKKVKFPGHCNIIVHMKANRNANFIDVDNIKF